VQRQRVCTAEEGVVVQRELRAHGGRCPPLALHVGVALADTSTKPRDGRPTPILRVEEGKWQSHISS
jgi:hypothetical protein